MRHVLLIGHNDIRQFIRGFAGYVWLFVVPIGFMYITGSASQGPGTPSSPKPSVLVENLDSGFLGKLFVEEIGTHGLRLIESNKTEEANRTLRIPVDLTQKIQKREPVKLEFVKLKGSRVEAATMIEMRMTKALLGLNAHLFEYAQASKETPVTVDEQQFRSLLQEEDPVQLQVSFAGRKPIPTGFNQSLPGYMVMFLMMNLLIFGGSSVATERQTGVIKRLAVYPLSRTELVLGKIYGRLLLGLVQMVVFILAGVFLFRVNLGDQLFGIVLTLSIYSWLAAALGVLIGAVTRNPEQTVGLCVLVSILMAALGGCWWPLEVVPDTLKTVGHFVPSAWAMDALHSLISFGEGISAIGIELLVLTAFAAGSTLAAGKFFRI